MQFTVILMFSSLQAHLLYSLCLHKIFFGDMAQKIVFGKSDFNNDLVGIGSRGRVYHVLGQKYIVPVGIHCQ